jgi:membrane fusion protein (multidrug efflux system)
VPDANDPQIGKIAETERPSPAQSARRFVRGLSHDVGRTRRIKIQHVIAAIVLVAGAAWGGTEIHNRITHVFEYDARISGDLVTLSSRVAGWVTNIAVTEGDTVSQDQILFQIDGRESKLKVIELDARLKRNIADRERLRRERGLIDEQIRTRYRTLESAVNAAEATVASLAAQLTLAQADLVRAEALFKTTVIPRRQLDEARTTKLRIEGEHRKSVAGLHEAQARLQESDAERARLDVIDGEIAMLEHEESELLARQAQQQLDFTDRTIRAPVAGVIDRKFVDGGEYVTPGQRLAIMHNPAKVWIDANIKETDVRKLKIGQPVKVSVDAYPDEEFKGTVAIIGNAATSEFALLPTPNPSGNFTKITQRLPVRISIDQQDGKLRPGMMVEVNIDIR